MGKRKKLCAHCRKYAATESWTVSPCILNNRKVRIPLCERCDINLNAYILRFMRHPRAKACTARYRAKLRAKRNPSTNR
jgi:hypothetical protein